jgi:hypothetical protein
LFQKSAAEMRFSRSASSCDDWEASKIPPQIERAFAQAVIPPNEFVKDFRQRTPLRSNV